MSCKNRFPAEHADATNIHSNMPVDALEPLVRALLSQLPEDPSITIITVKSDSISPVAVNGQGPMSEGLIYDPSIVYLLELCTVLALRDHETIKTLGEDVAGALQNVIRDAANYHSTMISRAVFYLLSLLRASYVSTTSSRIFDAQLIPLGILLPQSTCCSPQHIKFQK
jgi:hypothetical protein